MRPSAPEAVRSHTLRWLLLIVVVGLAARLYRIDNPVLDFHSWRQCDTAAMARNFLRNGFDILKPQVDQFGPGELVECEFQLYTFTVAVVYKLAGTTTPDGDVSVIWGRLVSVACALATLLILFDLARRLWGERTALWAALFYAVLPFQVYFTRQFQPDSMMLMFSAGAVYCFYRWQFEGRRAYAAGACLALSLAILTKATAALLGFPLVYLAWQAHGFRLLRKPSLWAFALAACLPAAAWYAYAHQFIFMKYGHTFIQWNLGEDKWADSNILTSAKFYQRLLFARIVESCLLYPGTVLFLAGIGLQRWGAPRTSRAADLDLAWLGGVGVYFLVVAKGNWEHHYYQLPFMLPAVLIMGRGVVALSDQPIKPTAWRGWGWRTWLLLLSLVVMIPMLFLRSYHWYDVAWPEYRAGKELQALTAPQDLVVAHGEDGPQTLYISDRQGWWIRQGDWSQDWVRDKARRGARYFATTYVGVFDGDKEFSTWMRKTYPLVKDDPQYLIFQLNP